MLSNRDKLKAAFALVEEVARNETVGPTPCGHLLAALRGLEEACGFALDASEREGFRRVLDRAGA